MTVTCFQVEPQSRLGRRLGQGEKLDDILASTITVAEGLPTARSAYRLAQTLRVTTPIIAEVHAMLYEGKNVVQALRDLTGRDSKPES